MSVQKFSDLAGDRERAYAPHCDPRVLHAPGECKHCDKYPDWQGVRELWVINFTRHRDPEKLVCPAETRRTVGVIELWGGNVPAKP